MGDMADDLLRHLERDMWLDDISKLPPTTPAFIWWVQKDGTRIHIKDMTDSHIMNCINMIDRRDNWRTAWKKPLLYELENRQIMKHEVTFKIKFDTSNPSDEEDVQYAKDSMEHIFRAELRISLVDGDVIERFEIERD